MIRGHFILPISFRLSMIRRVELQGRLSETGSHPRSSPGRCFIAWDRHHSAFVVHTSEYSLKCKRSVRPHDPPWLGRFSHHPCSDWRKFGCRKGLANTPYSTKESALPKSPRTRPAPIIVRSSFYDSLAFPIEIERWSFLQCNFELGPCKTAICEQIKTASRSHGVCGSV
jgi:hypothetical protein